MSRPMLSFVILTVQLFLSTVVLASDYRLQAEAIFEDMRDKQPCGEFVSKEGLFKQITFGDKNNVTVIVSGFESKLTYFIKGDNVLILMDKALLELEIRSPDILVGKDECLPACARAC